LLRVRDGARQAAGRALRPFADRVGPQEDDSATLRIEWRLGGTLVLFRLLHLGQLATTVAAFVGEVSNAAAAAVLVGAVAAEGVWFSYRVVDLHRYDYHRGLCTALVELASAVFALTAASVLLSPGPGGAANLAPLLVLSTGQVTGSVLAGRKVLVAVGPVLVAAAYSLAVLRVEPAAFGRSDVIIGVTGYFVIPALAWIGASHLRGLAVDLDQARRDARRAGESLSSELAHRRFGEELHNYLINVIGSFLATDPADAAGMAGIRQSFEEVERRLRSYLETGRFSHAVPLLDMIDRQIETMRREGLVVVPTIAGAVRTNPPAVPPDDVETLENILRAVLINARHRARVTSTVLSLAVGGGCVDIAVVDRGPGFDTAILERRGAGGRSLVRHRDLLRSLGGDLTARSQPGRTEIRIRLPVAGDAATGGRHPDDRPAGGGPTR
jgi:signal transduction histidine kinase